MVGRYSLRSLFVLAGAFTAAACGQAESGTAGDDPSRVQGSKQSFAATLDGTDAMVAAVQNGSNWVFYVCGGETTQATLTRWLQARFDSLSGASSMQAAERGVTLTFTPGLDSISGTLQDEGGNVYAFEAARIDASSAEAAGLYAAMDSGCRTGLVVVPSASGAPGRTQGVWCDSSGRVGQVTPIMPIQLSDRGLAVLAGPESRLLHLLPAIPPLD